MPRIYAAAILPARYGSSEKYSKFLPQRGSRFIQVPGPNKNNKVASTIAGSDLEMPSCRYGADDIVKAVESGELDIKYVDESVERILTLVEGAGGGSRLSKIFSSLVGFTTDEPAP